MNPYETYRTTYYTDWVTLINSMLAQPDKYELHRVGSFVTGWIWRTTTYWVEWRIKPKQPPTVQLPRIEFSISQIAERKVPTPPRINFATVGPVLEKEIFS